MYKQIHNVPITIYIRYSQVFKNLICLQIYKMIHKSVLT